MTRPRQVATHWDAATQGIPTLAANVFSLQITGSGEPEEVVMSVGYAAPPIFTGSPEEQQRQAEALEAVVITPVVRLSITPGRLRELLGLVQTVVDNLDGAMAKEVQP